MKHLGRTPPFRGPHGEVVAGSVAEVAYRRLGGIDQWVMIRGESVANPPLILLHGGPGLSETGLFRYFNAPLERSFTVVYWDQRGAGKSFDRAIPRSSMTVEQFISDLDELVDIACELPDKTKVVILGHSWGSALGVLYAARFPEKVAAYVGSAQVGDWEAGEAGSYEWALAEAQRVGNRRAVRKLRAIGPPPYLAAAVFTDRPLVSRFEGQMRLRATNRTIEEARLVRAFQPRDVCRRTRQVQHGNGRAGSTAAALGSADAVSGVGCGSSQHDHDRATGRRSRLRTCL